MNRRKSIDDYRELAQELDMIFVPPSSPRHVTTSTEWRCKRCNRPVKKSYNQLKHYDNPCRCWNGIQMPKQAYLDQAKRLSDVFRLKITLVESKFEIKNIREKVEWHIEQLDTSFWASYRQLAYAKRPELVEKYAKEVYGEDEASVSG